MKIDKTKVVLDFPSAAVSASYIAALEEGFYRGIQPVKSVQEIANIKADFNAHLVRLNDQTPKQITTPSGFTFTSVPYEVLWMTQDDFFIGEVSFYKELNEVMLNYGGNVGYGIRPSLQGNGLGAFSLKLLRDRAHKMGMDKLLVTCDPKNTASDQVIQDNGGKFIDMSQKTYGYAKEVKRYWVPTRTC